MENQLNIRAVIFDLGGVILRTDNPGPRTRLAESLGKTRNELENIVFGNPLSLQAERGLASDREVWVSIVQTLQLPEDDIPRLRRAFFEGDRVDFDLIRLIQSLRKTYRTALLSNTWIVDLPAFLRNRLQIPDTFDVVVSSADRKTAKPDPEIFLYTLEQVKAKPEEAIFVDDNLKNVEAASSLGIRTVRFFNLEQLKQDLALFIDIP